MSPDVTDVVVVGSGLVGACCAYELASAGLSVVVADRGSLTGGTTASGEGNILVSDKPPGPELTLALRSVARWGELDAELETDIELEAKGGVVVATGDDGSGLAELVTEHGTVGVQATMVGDDELHELEPELAEDLTVGAWYPQDHHVQPVLASSALLWRARQRGAELRRHTTVTGLELDAHGHVGRVHTDLGDLACRWVVNAAGPWSPEVARLAGAQLPVAPRRGHVLVSEPCPPMVHHKVYEASYVDTLTADEGEPQVSSVVESTRSGTLLIGSSREFVGFEERLDLGLVRRIARRAVRLYPRLAGVALMRAYAGFRPYVPDHLPIIGADDEVPGLVHATGHEGAGIGLAPATGELVRAVITQTSPPVDPAPFSPGRATLRAKEQPHA